MESQFDEAWKIVEEVARENRDIITEKFFQLEVLKLSEEIGVILQEKFKIKLLILF